MDAFGLPTEFIQWNQKSQPSTEILIICLFFVCEKREEFEANSLARMNVCGTLYAVFVRIDKIYVLCGESVFIHPLFLFSKNY